MHEIVNVTVLNMAKDMVDVLSVCGTEVTNEIDTVITIKKGIPDTTYIYTFIKEN